MNELAFKRNNKILIKKLKFDVNYSNDNPVLDRYFGVITLISAINVQIIIH